MIEKYHGGVVTHKEGTEAVDKEFIALVNETVAGYSDAMDHMELNQAIKDVWNLIGRANKYIDETAPWILAKDPAQAERLQAVMYNLAEALRIIAILIARLCLLPRRKFTNSSVLANRKASLWQMLFGANWQPAPKCRRANRCSRALKLPKPVKP